LILFEQVISRLQPWNNFTPPPSLLESLSESYGIFLTAFSAWKSKDSSAMVQTMIGQYVELDAILQTVKESTDESIANAYQDGIRENQMLLLVRIKRLAGADKGKAMVRDAIRLARRAKARKPLGDVKPRGASASNRPSSGPSHLEARGSTSLLPGGIAQELQPVSQHGSAPLAPKNQNAPADELGKVMSRLPDNRFLVHELAINREYRIESTDTGSQAREAINKVVFDNMRVGIANGDGDRWTLAMADHVRSRLLRLLASGNSLHTLVSETIDLEMIAQECRRGAFSFERFFKFVLHILPQLCAPFRDADVKSLSSPETERLDTVDRLAKLLHVIDLMGLDYANYLLQQSAPTLIKHSAEYEQKMFAQDLESGSRSLTVTKQWWKTARTKAFNEAAKRDPEGANSKNRPTSDRIYMEGLVDLIISPVMIADLPETLLLDNARVARLRKDAMRIIGTGTITLTAKNLLRKDVRSQWTEARRIFSLLNHPSETSLSSTITSTIASAHAFPPTAAKMLSSTIARVITALQRSSSGVTESGPALTDPVMRLLFNRLKAHVLGRLTATSSSERVKAASTASESLAGVGLPEFVGLVGGMIDEIGRVARVDWEGHRIWYEEIAKECDEVAAATTTATTTAASATVATAVTGSA
jgi:hypothetical protein